MCCRWRVRRILLEDTDMMLPLEFLAIAIVLLIVGVVNG
jgi:hypothetical protein